MSEAHRLPSTATGTADALARILVRAVLADKPPAKLAKVIRQLNAVAEEMEASALACATVYPLHGGGAPIGGRPADLLLRAAADALRAVVNAEAVRAVHAAYGHRPPAF